MPHSIYYEIRYLKHICVSHPLFVFNFCASVRISRTDHFTTALSFSLVCTSWLILAASSTEKNVIRTPKHTARFTWFTSCIWVDLGSNRARVRLKPYWDNLVWILKDYSVLQLPLSPLLSWNWTTAAFCRIIPLLQFPLSLPTSDLKHWMSIKFLWVTYRVWLDSPFLKTQGVDAPNLCILVPRWWNECPPGCSNSWVTVFKWKPKTLFTKHLGKHKTYPLKKIIAVLIPITNSCLTRF